MSIEDWPGFNLGQTTALAGGSSSYFNDVNSRLNFYSHFPNKSVHEARQVHGANLQTIRPYSSCYQECDGLFASRSRALLTMRTADCYPVFLREHSGFRFGLVHAGWRGVGSGIIKKALQSWFEDSVDIILGAGIEAAHYEVGEEVLEEIEDYTGLTRKDLSKEGILQDDHLSLPQLIRFDASNSRINVTSIRKLPYDTYSSTEPPLLSYRNKSTDKRMLSWMMKK